MPIRLHQFARPNVWQTVRLGDGGETQAIHFYADGTALNRTDTYGGYLLNRTTGKWSQLFDARSVAPVGFSADRLNTGGGAYELVAAPSNTNTFYAFLRGSLIKSLNRGYTWNPTGFPDEVGSPPNDYCNSNASKGKNKIAVDPQNENFLFAASPFDWNASPTNCGLKWTADGGATWNNIPVSSIPACLEYGSTGQPGGYIVECDASSSVVSGKKQVWYAFSYGHDVYKTTNAGASWSPLSCPSTTIMEMHVDANGILWAVDESAGVGYGRGTTYKYDGSWHTIDPTLGGQARGIAIDLRYQALGSTVLYCQADYMTANRFSVTSDSGGSFTKNTHDPTLVCDDIPWIGWMMNTGADTLAGGMEFDPYDNSLWTWNGLACLKCATPPLTNVAYSWVSQTAPIEQLVTTKLLKVPGGPLLVGTEDMGVFVLNDWTQYPATHLQDPSFAPHLDFSYSPFDYNTIAFMIVQDGIPPNDRSGVSHDAGATSTTFNTLGGKSGTSASQWIPYAVGSGAGGSNGPGGWNGGMLAVSGTNNYCAIRGDYGDPNYLYYTTNGGVTWTPATGLPTLLGTDFAYYASHHCLERDRNVPGTFYLHLSAGLYISTNYGASWALQSNFNPGAFNGGAQLKASPDVSPGHSYSKLYYTPGRASNDGLYISLDQGVTWTKIGNTYDIFDLGFGPPNPGKSIASLWVWGQVAGSGDAVGLFNSGDDGTTWTKMDGANPVVAGLSDAPGGTIDQISSMDVDQLTWGLVFIGTKGHGAIWRQF